MPSHILAASDLSHRAEPAIARAGELASRLGAKLTLLHVLEHDQPGSSVERELEVANEALVERAGQLRAGGLDVDVRVAAADPFEEIGDAASNVGADLIVLGRHRRRPFRDLFAGTTVERVIWRGTHPVLMV